MSLQSERFFGSRPDGRGAAATENELPPNPHRRSRRPVRRSPRPIRFRDGVGASVSEHSNPTSAINCGRTTATATATAAKTSSNNRDRRRPRSTAAVAVALLVVFVGSVVLVDARPSQPPSVRRPIRTDDDRHPRHRQQQQLDAISRPAKRSAGHQRRPRDDGVSDDDDDDGGGGGGFGLMAVGGGRQQRGAIQWQPAAAVVGSRKDPVADDDDDDDDFGPSSTGQGPVSVSENYDDDDGGGDDDELQEDVDEDVGKPRQKPQQQRRRTTTTKNGREKQHQVKNSPPATLRQRRRGGGGGHNLGYSSDGGEDGYYYRHASSGNGGGEGTEEEDDKRYLYEERRKPTGADGQPHHHHHHHQPSTAVGGGQVSWRHVPTADGSSAPGAASASARGPPSAWERYLEESQKRRIDAIKQQILSSLGMKTPPLGISSKIYSPEQRDKMRQEFAKANPSAQLSPAEDEQPCEALVEKTQSFFPQCDPPRKIGEHLWNRPGTFNIYFKVSPSPPRADVRPEVLQASLHLFKLPLPDGELLGVQKPPANTSTPSNHDLGPERSSNDKQMKITIHSYVGKIRKGKVRTRPLVHKWVSWNRSSWVTFPIDAKTVTRWMEQRKSRNFGLAVTVQRKSGEFMDPVRVFSRKDCSNKHVKETPLPGILERVAVTDVRNQVRVARRKYPTLDVKYVEIPISSPSSFAAPASSSSTANNHKNSNKASAANKPHQHWDGKSVQLLPPSALVQQSPNKHQTTEIDGRTSQAAPSASTSSVRTYGDRDVFTSSGRKSGESDEIEEEEGKRSSSSSLRDDEHDPNARKSDKRPASSSPATVAAEVAGHTPDDHGSKTEEVTSPGAGTPAAAADNEEPPTPAPSGLGGPADEGRRFEDRAVVIRGDEDVKTGLEESKTPPPAGEPVSLLAAMMDEPVTGNSYSDGEVDPDTKKTIRISTSPNRSEFSSSDSNSGDFGADLGADGPSSTKIRQYDAARVDEAHVGRQAEHPEAADTAADGSSSASTGSDRTVRMPDDGEADSTGEAADVEDRGSTANGSTRRDLFLKSGWASSEELDAQSRTDPSVTQTAHRHRGSDTAETVEEDGPKSPKASSERSPREDGSTRSGYPVGDEPAQATSPDTENEPRFPPYLLPESRCRSYRPSAPDLFVAESEEAHDGVADDGGRSHSSQHKLRHQRSRKRMGRLPPSLDEASSSEESAEVVAGASSFLPSSNSALNRPQGATETKTHSSTVDSTGIFNAH